MFVLSYFQTASENLHLAVSGDGFAWTLVRGGEPVLKSEVGVCAIRDPHLSQDESGVFHLLWSNGWQSRSIGHCTSRDLVHWSQQELIPVMESVPHAQNAWAPECFYDREADLYRIIWASTVGEVENKNDYENLDHRIWSSATPDFKNYSAPEIFFDPGYNVIDASVAWHDGVYRMAFKDERGENRSGTSFKAMRVVKAKRATGPFDEISELVTPPLTEGPTLFRREDAEGGAWIMLFDHFSEGFFGAMSSRDGRNWMNITSQMQFPTAPRHASVIEVNEKIAHGLTTVS